MAKFKIVAKQVVSVYYTYEVDALTWKKAVEQVDNNNLEYVDKEEDLWDGGITYEVFDESGNEVEEAKRW